MKHTRKNGHSSMNKTRKNHGSTSVKKTNYHEHVTNAYDRKIISLEYTKFFGTQGN